LETVIQDVKKRIERLDNRVWATLISVVFTILLMLWQLLTH